ncbi:hypothetical protein AKJ47_01150 [candidate division MSBL1 archaeon SCGC-AAA261G05]|uniref:YprB ribonuclease H-like domain-containing protein n=3 Tax=candidate division MSBL1 TaxID=215777 RepID=A0A133V0A0_9EURY|nr:hypothetical protein AKJ42_02335 [candidate division MSBL1 archaeon SCGC-AAA261C02]KXB03020.1 hypothetical protein AKJ48_04305 [candidate division MSBL1 archaeon SCGC-AAA261O19]KXB03988.1 hypothetical protein AKJ47_01150 [candidate division MSBL1 archaeon SCGC-AAA261G05]
MREHEADTVIAFNAPFDFRFIRTRALILQERKPLAGYYMFNEKSWLKSFTRFRRYSLDYVAKELGIGEKVGKGHQMPMLYWKGETNKIVKHCRKDVELLIRVHERCLEVEKGKKRITVIKESEPSKEKKEEKIPRFR